MAKGYKSGVSSLPAGLKIVGNPRPSRPKEGTVWCNTDVEPTGFYLSATQPENLVQGNIWIKISDSSTNKIGTALGKDFITIQLDSVSQYVNGAWVSVEAMSFQNGVWVEWCTYLIKKGVVGDIGFDGVLRSSHPPILTPKTGLLNITSTDSYSTGAATPQKIDVTKLSVLYAKIVVNTVYTGISYDKLKGASIALLSSLNNSTESNLADAIIAQALTNQIGEQTLELKLDGIDGSYYIGFVIPDGGTKGHTDVDIIDIWWI